MLGHMHPDLRQIEHLPDPMPNTNGVGEITLTASTDPRDMIDDPVRSGDLFEMPARMPLLAARLPARRTPQTLRGRLAQPV